MVSRHHIREPKIVGRGVKTEEIRIIGCNRVGWLGCNGGANGLCRGDNEVKGIIISEIMVKVFRAAPMEVRLQRVIGASGR